MTEDGGCWAEEAVRARGPLERTPAPLPLPSLLSLEVAQAPRIHRGIGRKIWGIRQASHVGAFFISTLSPSSLGLGVPSCAVG